MTVIEDGHVVVIQRHNYLRTHKINLAKNPNVQLGKETVDVSAAVGESYGAAFKMVLDNNTPGGGGGSKKGGGGGNRKWRLERTDEVVDFEEMFLGDEEEKASRSTICSQEDVEAICTFNLPHFDKPLNVP